eukprot:GHUV01035405.1.p1 GENE.GHUV01035405.1~~GHUV01035405.1.p1  ORF type:complete len:129 (-),score=18.66 GHUV01035405.1:182-568(-)
MSTGMPADDIDCICRCTAGRFVHSDLHCGFKSVFRALSTDHMVVVTCCRFSVVDPWMHEKGDGFPLLYVRSHAARLPGSVVRDFLVRCKVALAASSGRLVLKVTVRLLESFMAAFVSKLLSLHHALIP